MLTMKKSVTLIACCLAMCSIASGQTASATALEIEIQNGVTYWHDLADPSQLATSPAVLRPSGRTFMRWVFVGDIVQVNGKSAKGLAVYQGTQLPLAPGARPGQAIADVARASLSEFRLEIQQADGTPIGSIMGFGINGGTPPPGPSRATAANNNAVIGGTGAFLGMRGQHLAITVVPPRQTSMAEDPANRRTHGGGTHRAILYLIPLCRPEIVTARDGPAIFHRDFSPITAANPAAPGEVLIVRATGLGPVRDAADSGQPFPADPLAIVNSPVEVSVSGVEAEVINQIGWPGSFDEYRVDFRVPSGIATGVIPIRLSAAWIPGSVVTIPVR